MVSYTFLSSTRVETSRRPERLLPGSVRAWRVVATLNPLIAALGALLMAITTATTAHADGFVVPDACGSRATFDDHLQELLGRPDVPAPPGLTITKQADGLFRLALVIGADTRNLVDKNCKLLLRAAALMVAAHAEPELQTPGTAGPRPAQTPPDQAPTKPAKASSITAAATGSAGTPEAEPQDTSSVGQAIAPGATAAPGGAQTPLEPAETAPEQAEQVIGPASAGLSTPAAAPPPSSQDNSSSSASTDAAALTGPSTTDADEATSSNTPELPVSAFVGLAVGGVVRQVPALSPRAELDAKVDLGALSLLLAVHYTLPQRAERSEGFAVNVQAFGGRLLAGATPVPWLALRLGPELTWVSGTGAGGTPSPQAGGAASLGLAAEVAPRLCITPSMCGEAVLMGRYAMLRPSFQVSGIGQVFRTPAWSGGFQVRVLLKIL